MRGIKESGMQIFAIIFISIMAIICITQNNWIGFVIDILLILSNVALIIHNRWKKKMMETFSNYKFNFDNYESKKIFLKNKK